MKITDDAILACSKAVNLVNFFPILYAGFISNFEVVVALKNNCPFEINVVNIGIIAPNGKKNFDFMCGLNPNLFVFHSLNSIVAPEKLATNLKEW